MPNEFEFSFLRSDIETLLVSGVTEIVVSAKVTYHSETDTSTFEISAEGRGTHLAPLTVTGCPKPCRS